MKMVREILKKLRNGMLTILQRKVRMIVKIKGQLNRNAMELKDPVDTEDDKSDYMTDEFSNEEMQIVYKRYK
jgi:hypothetical protein